jgi:hypothetical protein
MSWREAARGFHFFSYGLGGRGRVFIKLCLVWRVNYPLFTFHASFSFPPFSGGEEEQKVPQVLDMFPKEFPVTTHFYPICFGKCCPPFTFIGGPKGRNWLIAIKEKLNLKGTSSNE